MKKKYKNYLHYLRRTDCDVAVTLNCHIDMCYPREERQGDVYGTV